METRPFGPTGRPVSVIGQGTWQLRDKPAALRALRLGLALGLNHIDTAELYTGSEEVVGEAIRGRRADVFLVSKVLPKHASRRGVVDHCRASLARLGAGQLDVYLLHWLSHEHPVEESLRGLADAVDQGLTRFVGVSNFDLAALERAQSILGQQKVACDQVYHSPTQRGVENDLLPYCQRNRIALVSYSPFDSGKFPAPGSQRGPALAAVAARHGATPRQVALNFLARHEGVFVIPKAEAEAHVRDNAGALDFALTKEDVEELDAAFPRPRLGSKLAMV